MRSEKEISQILELFGLGSSQERERFRKMAELQSEDTATQECLFVRAVSDSKQMKTEAKDARLERDS